MYRLIGRSDMPKAYDFQDWVYEEVLPSIRKTGNYALPGATPAAKDGWAEKCAEGIELMRLKNATLQELTAGVLERIGDQVFATVANHINQAVLGYIEKTAAYKQKAPSAKECYHTRHPQPARTDCTRACRNQLQRDGQRGHRAAVQNV